MHLACGVRLIEALLPKEEPVGEPLYVFRVLTDTTHIVGVPRVGTSVGFVDPPVRACGVVEVHTPHAKPVAGASSGKSSNSEERPKPAEKSSALQGCSGTFLCISLFECRSSESARAGWYQDVTVEDSGRGVHADEMSLLPRSVSNDTEERLVDVLSWIVRHIPVYGLLECFPAFVKSRVSSSEGADKRVAAGASDGVFGRMLNSVECDVDLVPTQHHAGLDGTVHRVVV